MRVPTLLAALFVVAAAGCRDRTALFTPEIMGPSITETTGASLGTWQEVTKSWPEDAKAATKEMVDKYGPPDEMTPSELVWKQRGPWKRSVVSRDPVHHDWPSPHEDVLEQTISFRVPPERASDLQRFDGSVMFERTKGELGARCGGESANFLALNLAKEIIDGTKTVAEARATYERETKAKKSGGKTEYMSSLHFQPMPSAGDPDVAAAK